MTKTVFLLSGQGSQYYQMGSQLYENDTGFRRYMDELDLFVQSRINQSIVTLLYLIRASLGEYICLALAKVLPAKEILGLLIQHDRIVEETCEPGSMMGIIESPDLYEREPILHENSSFVESHSDRHFVISGFREKMVKIPPFLKEKRILFQELPISHGFHSPNMDPAFELCCHGFNPPPLNEPEKKRQPR